MESGFSRGYTRVARICATFPLRKIGLAHANLEDWKFRRAWFLRNQPPSWKGETVSRVGDTWTTRRPFGAAVWARKRTIRNRTRRCEIFRLSTKAKALVLFHRWYSTGERVKIGELSTLVSRHFNWKLFPRFSTNNYGPARPSTIFLYLGMSRNGLQ